jgi:hypothetical protein
MICNRCPCCGNCGAKGSEDVPHVPVVNLPGGPVKVGQRWRNVHTQAVHTVTDITTDSKVRCTAGGRNYTFKWWEFSDSMERVKE